MSYHLKYLKYKKKYLNLKAELEGGMIQPSAEDLGRLEESAECLFNQKMTEDNFMNILGDIAECDDEQILQDNRLDRENDYENLEKKIEKYFNFIKERQYSDVPEHARGHLELIADKLPRQFISVASLSSAISAVSGDPEATYKNIIKTRIDFLKSYGKLATIKSIKDELFESQEEIEKQKTTIEELDKQKQQTEQGMIELDEQIRKNEEDYKSKILDLEEQHQKKINEILRDTENNIKAVEQEKVELEEDLKDKLKSAEQETDRNKQEIKRIIEKAKGLIEEQQKEIEELNETHEQKIAELEEQIRKQEEEIKDFQRQLDLDRIRIEEQNKKIDKLSRAQYTLEQYLTSMDKTITSKEYMKMQLQSEKEKLDQDKLKLELSRLEIKDDNGKLKDSIIALQESNKVLKKELLEAKEANKYLNKVIETLNEKIDEMDKMGKEKTEEIAKLTREYLIARKTADMEIDDLKNQKNEKNKEINDLKDQVKSKDNTILKIRTKINKNLSKLIQNMIDTIEPKTYKQPPLFMI